MSKLFDDFVHFIYRNQNSKDICSLFNAFIRGLKGNELEFAIENFALFIMVGNAAHSAPDDVKKFLLSCPTVSR